MSETLTPQTLNTLLEMARWWKSRPGIMPPRFEARPVFLRTENATRSLRIPKALFTDATIQAHRDGIPTFNELVKLLLWEYLGRGEKYLLKDPE